jgi:hypothetical protein
MKWIELIWWRVNLKIGNAPIQIVDNSNKKLPLDGFEPSSSTHPGDILPLYENECVETHRKSAR